MRTEPHRQGLSLTGLPGTLLCMVARLQPTWEWVAWRRTCSDLAALLRVGTGCVRLVEWERQHAPRRAWRQWVFHVHRHTRRCRRPGCRGGNSGLAALAEDAIETALCTVCCEPWLLRGDTGTLTCRETGRRWPCVVARVTAVCVRLVWPTDGESRSRLTRLEVGRLQELGELAFDSVPARANPRGPRATTAAGE